MCERGGGLLSGDSWAGILMVPRCGVIRRRGETAEEGGRRLEAVGLLQSLEFVRGELLPPGPPAEAFFGAVCLPTVFLKAAAFLGAAFFRGRPLQCVSILHTPNYVHVVTELWARDPGHRPACSYLVER
jgi:hypothetical protein